jgi:FixJ family two-component response regulator/signal transduction histidine kinase
MDAQSTVSYQAQVGAHGDALNPFERLLADLSTRFINLPADRIDDAITDTLRRIVEEFGVDRSQLIRFLDGGDTVITHAWAMEGVPVVAPRSIESDFPWALRRLRAGHPIVAPRIDDLPQEAAVDKETWRRAGVKSNLTMPMTVAGGIEGMIAFGCLRREHDWTDELVERMRVLATIFGNALAHKRAREALDAAVEFEQTASNVMATLLTSPREEQGRLIETGLRDVARLFGAERATLWRRVRDEDQFRKVYRWLADGIPIPEDPMGPVELPWISAQIAAGEVVRFARLADLPPQAAGDLPRLHALNIRAMVMVPLTFSGSVVGALSFATASHDRDWPEALLPRVMLLGEVFAGMLAREEAERREQEARAHAAHAARVGTMGVVAASLVHELTQPLAASLANAETAAELLRTASPDLAELRETVADILADDRRAGELIQQLRHFLRRGEVQKRSLVPRELVDEALRLVANEAAAKGVALVLDLADALPTLVGDRVQIEQVLVNLLLNAFEAVSDKAPEGRSVVVRTAPTGSGVSIEVIDSGRGMDATTLASIFQPFFTTKAGGMGLGLSISRTIIASHGGRLSVQSAPGTGSTFRFELPSENLQEVRPVRPAALSGDETGTVFVIDDDPSMCRAIERQLLREGFRIATFASAQAYLDKAPDVGAACIVSDVRMPGLSGLDLQASLAHAKRPLPIVFVSGHSDIPTTVHAMKAGAVSFLAKPFNRSELVAAVTEALARGRALAGARRQDAEIERRYESLTPREREVLVLVAAGLLNKVIADRLGAAESTVKIHRGRVMEKMRAESVADLVRMAERLGLSSVAGLEGANSGRATR